jgi:hypothetical protein
MIRRNIYTVDLVYATVIFQEMTVSKIKLLHLTLLRTHILIFCFPCCSVIRIVIAPMVIRHG